MIKAWILVVVSAWSPYTTTVEMKEFNTRNQCIHVGKEVVKMDRHLKVKCISTSGKFESVDIPRYRGH